MFADGRFPCPSSEGIHQRRSYPIVRDIYNSAIFTDIVRRNHIRKIDQFERVVRYVFNNVGNSAGAMLENIVYLELKRRGYDVYVGKLNGYEIDFIATKQEEKIYVQVAKEIVNESTREREYGRLLEIEDNYPKYVLLDDDYAGGNYKGIKTIHIADFLLSKNTHK